MSVIEMPEPLGLFAGQLFDRGTEYLEAFEILSATGVPKYPAYFLCAHSLELFLKSFLAARGVSKSKIRHRRKQHDLPAIMEECNALSLPDVPDLKIFASAIYSMNEDFDFRYPTNFNLSVPKPEECSRVLHALRETISPIIARERMDANLQFAADTRNDKGKKVRWSD